jgi:two-component system nitrate/nitrite response regulator NarL
MRAILVGPAGDRDRVRWRLEGTGITVVGEFGSLAEARNAGLDADAFIVAAGEPGPARSRLDRGTLDAGVQEPLTPREVEVLQLLAEGLPNKAIAARLGISDQTVKFHVASITGKLGAANRTEAVRRAARRGLIDL